MHKSRKRANTGSRKCNCPFMIEAQEHPTGKWRGRVLVEYHNHDPSAEATSHPSHRQSTLVANKDIQAMLERLLNRQTAISTIRSELEKVGITLTSSNLYNLKQRIRNIQLEGSTVIQ
jgi:hypothetical protein